MFGRKKPVPPVVSPPTKQVPKTTSGASAAHTGKPVAKVGTAKPAPATKAPVATKTPVVARGTTASTTPLKKQATPVTVPNTSSQGKAVQIPKKINPESATKTTALPFKEKPKSLPSPAATPAKAATGIAKTKSSDPKTTTPVVTSSKLGTTAVTKKTSVASPKTQEKPLPAAAKPISKTTTPKEPPVVTNVAQSVPDSEEKPSDPIVWDSSDTPEETADLETEKPIERRKKKTKVSFSGREENADFKDSVEEYTKYIRYLLHEETQLMSALLKAWIEPDG
ncbi:hypothetical protein CCP3SC1AL1_180022 [Gammaproteobacteria bacterium]